MKRSYYRNLSIATLGAATYCLLAGGLTQAAVLNTNYRYTAGSTPLECCDTFDTSNEIGLVGVYGDGNLNNGLIGFDIFSDTNAGNGEYRNGNTFAYQAEGTPGAGTEFNGTYSDSNDFNLEFDLGAPQILSTIRIDYNTNPAAGFPKPGDITISDGNSTVTILSSSLPAESDGAGRGVYQFVSADISSLTGQFLTVTIPNSGQFLGVNEITLEGVPVPEPTSLVLFGFGLAGLTAITRRRRYRG